MGISNQEAEYANVIVHATHAHYDIQLNFHGFAIRLKKGTTI